MVLYIKERKYSTVDVRHIDAVLSGVLVGVGLFGFWFAASLLTVPPTRRRVILRCIVWALIIGVLTVATTKANWGLVSILGLVAGHVALWLTRRLPPKF